MARDRSRFRLLLTLERSVLIELGANLLLILCVMTGVFFVGSLIQFLYRAKELGLSIVVAVLPHLIPSLAAWTIPSSLLLATIMTYGRMGEDNEVTAIRAAGVPIYHVVLPALFLAMVLSAVCFWLNTSIIPASNYRQRAIAQDMLGKFKSILEGSRENTYVFNRRRISWHEIDETGALIGLTIDRRRGESGAGEVLAASRARVGTDPSEEHLVFELEDATVHRYDETGAAVSSGRFARLPLTMRVEDLLGRPAVAKPKELDLRRLAYAIERNGQRRYPLDKLQEEMHERLVLSFAPFVLALLGASLGILARKGAFVTSFLLAFVVAGVPYYSLIMAGRALLESDLAVPAAIALWPADILMGGVGLLLLRKALRG